MATAVLTQPEAARRSAHGIRVTINGTVTIPENVVDLATFRDWAKSDSFPEFGRFCYFHGGVWVDLSMEQLYTHNQVKTAAAVSMFPLVQASREGRYFGDGAYLTHPAVGLSTVPDGMFVSFDAVREGRIRMISGAKDGFVEWEGTPDQTLEVVSDSSAEKDTVILRDLYRRAGVTEYWLIDARKSPVQFQILRRSPRGYSAVRRQAGGWLRSKVFGKGFQLVEFTDEMGLPDYVLNVRN